MSEFTLMVRTLSNEEATRISLALRDTPNILGYRPEELVRFPDAMVALSPEAHCAGVCLVKYLPLHWADIAVLYVFPEYRRKGVGTALFDFALRRLRDQKRTILCVSREPPVLRLMAREKMRFIGSHDLPLPVQLAYSRHYLSGYRFFEAIRKSMRYPNQPRFQYAVSREPHSPT